MAGREFDSVPDGMLNDMFAGIGKAKEDTARGIMKKRQEELEEIRRRRSGLFFGPSVDGVDENTDLAKLEEIERRIEAELSLARKGVAIAEEIPDGDASELPEGEDDLLLDFDMSEDDPSFWNEFEKAKNKESISTNSSPDTTDGEESDFDFDSDADAFQNDISEETEPRTQEPANQELDDKNANSPAPVEQLEIVDAVSDEDKAYISLRANPYNNTVCFSFLLITSGGKKITESKVLEAASLNQAAFQGAKELFDAIDEIDAKSVIVYLEDSFCRLLRRNATCGMVDGYSVECVDYVARAKEITAKRFIRFTSAVAMDSDKNWQYTESTANLLAD